MTEPKHFLSSNQLSQAETQELFNQANQMVRKLTHKKVLRILDGYVLGNVILEPSTRTRMSFEAAFKKLGGDVITMQSEESSSISKGESLYDSLQVISGYVDIVTLRTKEKNLNPLICDLEVPVINAGNSSDEHPTQALIDVYSMEQERGNLDGKTIALVGDLKNGRTIHSLIRLLDTMYRRLNIICIAPEELQLPEKYARSQKNSMTHSNTIESIDGAHIIYTTRIQEERMESKDSAAKYQGRLQIDKHILDKHCGPDVRIFHPLPRDTRPGSGELSTNLNHDPRLAIFRQAKNAIPIRMALFLRILKNGKYD